MRSDKRTDDKLVFGLDEVCRSCRGKGTKDGKECRACDGHGTIRRKKHGEG